jgi:sulfur-oxidizing protein SoxZ
MARTIINVPPAPKKGEVIEIRALIQHPMQTGYRPDAKGAIIPRDIVRRFTCHFQPADANVNANAARELVIEADLYPAIAANPYFAFQMVANAKGSLIFNWAGDKNFAQTETVALNVRE